LKEEGERQICWIKIDVINMKWILKIFNLRKYREKNDVKI